MTHIAEIPVNAFAAALTHAGRKDIRRYLTGVYLDFRKGRIVATDGCRLFCGRIPASTDQPCIVPRDAVEMLVKAWKQVPARMRPGALATVGMDQQRVTLAIPATGFSIIADPVDGVFPEYERGIPRKPNGEPAQYQPEYLVDASNALALYGGIRSEIVHSAHVAQNGSGPALVTWTGVTALAVVMPMRAPESGGLDWYK